MSIIFGVTDSRIGSFDPFDLELEKSPGADYKIEARQKYFHVFFIPCMPLDIIWVARKNGKRYQLPPEQENYLELNEPYVKTPWYSYAGPILLFLIIASVIITVKLGGRYDEYKETKDHEQRLSEIAQRIDSPQHHDLYRIIDSENQGYIFMRVQEITGDSTMFEVPDPQFLDFYKREKIVYTVADTSKAHKLIWINKKSLRSLILRKNEKGEADPVLVKKLSHLSKGRLRLDSIRSEDRQSFFAIY